ncbi:hypothetical protein [Curtobacterium herbarum]|nr:hypothetical protein [Curtobacterium herbarum]
MSDQHSNVLVVAVPTEIDTDRLISSLLADARFDAFEAEPDSALV